MSIFYSGGSGGFVLLHYILLWDQHCAGLPKDMTVKEVVDQQWSQTGKQWKHSEIWPDNKCVDISRQYRCRFFCNDFWAWRSSPGKKIIIYTDLDSQIALSQYKNAWHFNASADWEQISADLHKTAGWYQGHKVVDCLVPLFPLAYQTIYLQDFVNDPELIFGIPPTVDQLLLIQRWKSLHPPELLKFCGIES